MARYVTVKYLVPVFATVDLDAEPNSAGQYGEDAVVQVQQGDSDIHRVDDDLAHWLTNYVGAPDPLGEAYFRYGLDEGENPDPASLSREDRQKALDIAENNYGWPVWRGY